MRILILMACLMAISSCATINDARELEVGMSQEQINDKIGSPDGKLIDAEKDIYVYSLHKLSKGMQITCGVLTAGIFFIGPPKQDVYIEMKDGKLFRVR